MTDMLEGIMMGVGARGCGKKKDGGLYACVGMSEYGKGIDEFIIDPAHPWVNGPFRGPQFAERELADGTKVKDILMWVGAEHYPTVPDYIEEARNMGVSKRIPAGFPVDQLTPGKSRIVLIHPRAIPEYSHISGIDKRCKHFIKVAKEMAQLEESTGKEVTDADVMEAYMRHAHECTFDLWGLAPLHAHLDGRDVVDMPEYESSRIVMPMGGTYTVKTATKPIWFDGQVTDDDARPVALTYKAGAFAAFYLTHFEICAMKTDPTENQQRVNEAGWGCRVVDDEGRER